MKVLKTCLISFLFFLSLTGLSFAADVVPTEVQLPGTQPLETNNLESPDKCDNCHAGYNDAATAAAGEGEPQDEPATGWRGAAMGNAGRDPIFWATLAIAEQDFDGAGDLCIRCHSTGGWYGGRSTPTDASGLAASDSDGVDCDTCHSMTNPDDSELLGEMNSPFIANCSPDPNLESKNCDETTEGFYGSGMTSLWSGSDKLGPYSDADARHRFMQSQFHRSVDFCGTCHDVSNSVVGDLAPGNGAQPGAPAVVSSQTFHGGIPNLGGPVEEKAGFNNPPYSYGVVERTFSEYKSSAFPTTLVSAFGSLPDDLKVDGGSIKATYDAAMLAGTGGNYADGTDRFFSCQSCHMRPVNSAGANKRGVLVRADLPQHDHTGGNYWLADMIKYQDARGLLRLGGGLSSNQLSAIDLGQARAVEHLRQAASLLIEDDVLKVVNLTGHKLISGYPEGRRMWLNIKWYGSNGLIREDGAYGPLVDDLGNAVMVANPAGGPDVQVESILDIEDANMRIYEAHYAMTKEWADVLLATGKPEGFILNYDRFTGNPDKTLIDLASKATDAYEETFHFALNNFVAKDNRIPPYGMRYDDAKKRNALPVPDTQYGGQPGGIYNYWDTLDLNGLKPEGATAATITLYYQGTSWEYIQFLVNANTGENAFLGQEGVNMLDAWINAEVPVAIEVAGDRKMVPPIAMASATWGSPPVENTPPVAVGDVYSTQQDSGLTVSAPGVLANDYDEDGDSITAELLSDVSNGDLVLNVDGSFQYSPEPGYTGSDSFTYQANDGSVSSAIATVSITVTATGGDPVAGVEDLQTGVLTGKGKSKTFTETSTFSQGDSIIIRFLVLDANGNGVAGATVNADISGPESSDVTSGASDASGIAEAIWNTSSPNRKGNGGTALGEYTLTTTGVIASGYSWNGVGTSRNLAIQ